MTNDSNDSNHSDVWKRWLEATPFNTSADAGEEVLPDPASAFEPNISVGLVSFAAPEGFAPKNFAEMFEKKAFSNVCYVPLDADTFAAYFQWNVLTVQEDPQGSLAFLRELSDSDESCLRVIAASAPAMGKGDAQKLAADASPSVREQLACSMNALKFLTSQERIELCRDDEDLLPLLLNESLSLALEECAAPSDSESGLDQRAEAKTLFEALSQHEDPVVATRAAKYMNALADSLKAGRIAAVVAEPAASASPPCFSFGGCAFAIGFLEGFEKEEGEDENAGIGRTDTVKAPSEARAFDSHESNAAGKPHVSDDPDEKTDRVLSLLAEALSDEELDYQLDAMRPMMLLSSTDISRLVDLVPHSESGDELLARLAKCPDEATRAAIANKIPIPDAALDLLKADQAESVRRELLSNSAALRKLGDGEIASLLRGNASLIEALPSGNKRLAKILQDVFGGSDDPEVRKAVASYITKPAPSLHW